MVIERNVTYIKSLETNEQETGTNFKNYHIDIGALQEKVQKKYNNVSYIEMSKNKYATKVALASITNTRIIQETNST